MCISFEVNHDFCVSSLDQLISYSFKKIEYPPLIYHNRSGFNVLLKYFTDYFASSQSNNSYIMNFTSENVTSENNISMSTSQASSIDTTPAFEFWK